MPDIGAVDENGAGRRGVKTADQFYKRGLSRAVETDNRQFFPFGDHKAQVVDGVLLVAGVAVADMAEFDGERRGGKGRLARRVAGGKVQKFPDFTKSEVRPV